MDEPVHLSNSLLAQRELNTGKRRCQKSAGRAPCLYAALWLTVAAMELRSALTEAPNNLYYNSNRHLKASILVHTRATCENVYRNLTGKK